MIRVCISGLGKTGKEIAKVLMEQQDIKLVSAICSPNSDKKGRDLGEVTGSSSTGIIIESSDNLEQVIFRTRPDVVVDFSSPEAALKNAKVFSRMKVNIIIGTTGFSKIGLKKLLVLATKHRNAIVYAPNITLGVNVLMLLANLASNILNSYDFQITEIHHKHKKDAPSGTAKKIAVEIEKGIKASGNLSENIEIPITAVRAGGVVGKHEVMIIGDDDKIEISHESFSRKAFALGALQAVRFAKGKVGYFEMSDVLNLKKVLGDYLENENSSFKERYTVFLNKKELQIL
ncbi:4-hydroxy-tetrahydrodipicolinate reductase [Pseudobacteroides cellulosolvens]|uniref:4-hydroxy-tetrahydrodipicolinate reductase n=1 Tax=Pseudobacteroides cellulosolvens ATCC 35603 = DSM 2933 TaxID=398512 RepID=A0A0L6JVD5_9FIRM|nr:4-hydroxy-tetrahydrodipicolinate reductase [Pseudobacteroides cellulosolvens]KNY29392.1 Dihydrodipicolinate reductase [Pseudobacteroides cellulosolvens ATCC 35603 = DSM 2933]